MKQKHLLFVLFMSLWTLPALSQDPDTELSAIITELEALDDNATVTQAYDFTVDGIYYDSIAGTTNASVTYENTNYQSYTGAVTIPATVTYDSKTYTVTAIGSNAFLGSEQMTSLIIPEGITTIGGSSFYNCTGLTSITLPSTITTLGASAFLGCSNLATVNLASTSLTSVGRFVFSNCTDLATFYSNLQSTSVITSSSYFFYRSTAISSGTLYYPYGYSAQYSGVAPWSSFGTMSAFYDLTVKPLATNGTNYYATLFIDIPVTIPSGVTCYYVSAASGGALTLTSITGTIPASTGVIIATSSSSSYPFVQSSTTPTAITDNLLSGVTTQTTVNAANTYYYVLSRDEDANGNAVANSIGFYWYAAGGGSVTCPANRAYLPLSTSQAQGIRGFSFDRAGFVTTSINHLEIEKETYHAGEDEIYQLNGHLLESIPSSGIYIINGKKHFILKK